MRNFYSLFFTILAAFFLVACTKEVSPVKTKMIQDVQIYTIDNSKGLITPKTIEKAFTTVGLEVVANNDINKPFLEKFGKTHYKVYNLAIYQDPKLSFNLIKKYPNFGALIPLTMSIWSDKETLNISTLTTNGMARAVGIPIDDPDLVAYGKKIHQALKTAMPNGSFKELNYQVAPKEKTLAKDFTLDIDLNSNDPINWKENIQAEFESEMEPLGFLFPHFTNLQDEMFKNAQYDKYDFYDTYSVCKFNVIYRVSKLHPEAGAWAPCSFYFYKIKDENKLHVGWLSVENWITSLDIQDRESTEPLKDAQKMIEDILNKMLK